MHYAIWRACERFRILPPGLSETWEALDVWSQAQLLAFDQVREMEDMKFQVALAGAKPRF